MSNESPISKRLKEARLASGLSQKKLGIAAGMDEFSASARMNQYETGKHIPDFLTLKNISKVLGYPTAFFYADDDTIAKLIITFHKLSRAKRSKAIKYLDEV